MRRLLNQIIPNNWDFKPIQTGLFEAPCDWSGPRKPSSITLYFHISPIFGLKMAIKRNILQYGKMYESEKYLYGKGSDKIIVFFMAVKSDCYGNVNVDVRVRGTLKCSKIKFRSNFGDFWKLFNFKSLGASTSPPPSPHFQSINKVKARVNSGLAKYDFLSLGYLEHNEIFLWGNREVFFA